MRRVSRSALDSTKEYYKGYYRLSIEILSFHRILDEGESYFLPPMALYKKTFVKLLDCIQKHYLIKDLSEVAKLRSESSKKRGNYVCLTFDDGYRDNFEVARTILFRKGIPATFFVPVSQINKNEPYWWDYLCGIMDHDRDEFRNWTKSIDEGIARLVDLKPERKGTARKIVRRLNDYDEEKRNAFLYKLVSAFGTSKQKDLIMTWTEIKQLAEDGFAIGSHSLSHIPLTDLPDDLAKEEIEMSKTNIENKLNIDVEGFSYPRGSHTLKHAAMVEEAGYSYAVTTYFGKNRRGCDPFRLSRRNISDYHGIRSWFPITMYMIELSGILDSVLSGRR
jgi:peptidoglycan/xylan/chitin deacetylase (PgdA/CDA1 family)